MNEKSFSARNTIFIGGLPRNADREYFEDLLAPYAGKDDITVDKHENERDYRIAFIRLKHLEQAENAQRNLNGYTSRGRTLRVQLTNRTVCFKVLNLDQYVTDELLKKSFSAFGKVERAQVIVDEGVPSGTGLVEFCYKNDGKQALEACVENCFLLTSSLKPVILEEIKQSGRQCGYSEKQLPRNSAECRKAREVGPRFLTEHSSTEYVCALRWKSLYERRRQEEEELARRFRILEEQLDSEIKTLRRACVILSKN